MTLENRGEFRDTAWLRAAWEATVEGDVVASGELPLPAIEPGDTAEVSIPGWRLPEAGAGERWLTLRFLTAEATEWAEAGYEIGWAQVPLDAAAGGDAAPHQGWTGDVAVDDEGYLLHSSFAAPPALSLWRAPTDNDRIGGMADRWAGWGLATLSRRLDGIDRAGDAVTVRATWTTATGLEIAHTQRLTRSPDGGTRVEESVEIPAEIEDLARVGTVLELTPGHEAFEWFGRGPHETYPDRKRGGRVGRWWSTVTEQLVGLRPPPGERRPRRHALVPGERRRRRLDPRRPRPPRPGLGQPPQRRRSRDGEARRGAPATRRDHRPRRRRPSRPGDGELRPRHHRAVRPARRQLRWAWTIRSDDARP